MRQNIEISDEAYYNLVFAKQVIPAIDFLRGIGRWYDLTKHYPSSRRIRLRRFLIKDALSVWTKLSKQLQFAWLCVSGVKTGTRRIICLDELSFIIRLERRTTRDNSSTRIIHLVPVFIPERQRYITRRTTNAQADLGEEPRGPRPSFFSYIFKMFYDFALKIVL